MLNMVENGGLDCAIGSAPAPCAETSRVPAALGERPLGPR
jgi:hypothetical protein